jgi:hypothetical protein
MIDFEYKQTEETPHLLELLKDVERIQGIIKEHLKQPVLELPLKLNDMTLDQVQAPCSTCRFPLIDLRGVATHKFNILEIQLSGYCLECNTISTPIIRWYPDGHWCVCENGEWQQLLFVPPTFRDKISMKFYEIIDKFKKKK